MVKTKDIKQVPKLRFSEFEGEWKIKKLGKIAELTSSKRVYLSDYVDSGIPFYRGKEISELKRNEVPADILYITNQAYEAFKKKFGVPKKDDILITAVGTLGNVLRIRNNDKFYFKDGNLIWLRKISESPRFLETILEYKKREIEVISIGSTQRALTIVELNKLLFPFPTISEQEKIASFLSAVDKKIQQLTAKKELLEKYKKGVMQRIFSQEIRFADANGKDYPDWEEKQLGDVLNTIPTKPYQIKNSEILTNGILPVIDQGQKRIAGYSNENNKVFKNKGIIVYGDHTTILKYIDFDFIIGADGTKLLTTEGEDLKYLYYNLMYNNIEPEGYKRHFSILKKIHMHIPCISEQQKIASFLSSIDKKIESVQSQLEQTQEFKKGLLQQLFV